MEEIMERHADEKICNKETLWALFNRKWTRDTGTEGYDKEEWKKLEELILHFMKGWGR